MKILQVCPYLFPALTYGGPAKVVYELSKSLSSSNHVTVLTSDAWDENRRINESEKLKSTNALKILYFPNSINSLAFRMRFFSNFGSVFHVLSNVKKYDIIHLHDVFIIPNLFIGFIAHVFGVPFCVTPHGVIDPIRMQKKTLLKRILWPFVFYYFTRASKIIAVSKNEAKNLQMLGLKNVITITNGIEDSTLLNQNSPQVVDNIKKSSVLTILYIGKIHSQKGLLKVFSALRKINRDIRFIVAGPDDGELETLKSYASKHSLDTVLFCGYVNERQKEYLYSCSDVFVYPSESEGFSISILEAIRASVPVILSEGCNFNEVVKYKAGFVLKNTSFEVLFAELLNNATITKAVLKKMGKNARRMFLQSYLLQNMANAHLITYEQCIKN